MERLSAGWQVAASPGLAPTEGIRLHSPPVPEPMFRSATGITRTPVDQSPGSELFFPNQISNLRDLMPVLTCSPCSNKTAEPHLRSAGHHPNHPKGKLFMPTTQIPPNPSPARTPSGHRQPPQKHIFTRRTQSSLSIQSTYVKTTPGFPGFFTPKPTLSPGFTPAFPAPEPTPPRTTQSLDSPTPKMLKYSFA